MTTATQARDKTKIRALLAEWGRTGRGWSALASALGVAQYAAFAGFAFFAASAVSAFFAGEDFSSFFAGAIVLILVRAGLLAGETRAGAEAGAAVRAHVRRAAAEALCAKGPAYSERRETGETASRLIDAVERLEGYFARFAPLMPVLIGGPAILLLAAFAASPLAAAILLVAGPVLVLAMALVGAGAAAASRDQMTTLQRLAGRFNDRLQSLETLNAFNAAGREAEGLRAAAEDLRRRTMKVLRLAFLSSAVLETVSAFAIAAIAIFVGLSLLGRLGFGPGPALGLESGLFLLLIAPEFFAPLRRFSAAYHDRADAEAAGQALLPLFIPPAADTHKPAPVLTRAPQIAFSKVASRYEAGRTGLEPLSFTAPADKITVLWGPSGAGKSTALKLLMGYAPLSEGEIGIDGAPLAAPLTGQAGWIAQRPRLFHGTLRDNITLFDPAIGPETVQAAAETAGIMDFAASLPDGLHTRLGERGFGLSGGQAQRVALARAFAADMKLLLLDEPTAHLDGEAEARFLDALRRGASGRTVIIATHSPAVRAIADHLVDLPAGEAAA